MDGTRFDDAARQLANGMSLRTVLRGLVAGVAGIFAAKAISAAAVCTPPGPMNYCNFDVECCANAICNGGVCRCASGYKQCGSQCIPTSQTCLIRGAAGPIKRCNGTCTDTRSDRKNCGSCGNVCGLKQSCSNGHCCAPGKIWCDGVCKPMIECS